MSDLVYFDSCVFLAWLKDEENRANLVEELFEEARKGEIKIITSTLTIAEVLNIQGVKSPIPKERRDDVRRMFQNEWIITKGVNRRLAESSQEMVWEHGIKPKDGIHVATALAYKIPVFLSYDDNLVKRQNLITSIGKIQISEPVGSKQLSLLSLLG
jgi:predicted nucleic acid-binding protein